MSDYPDTRFMECCTDRLRGSHRLKRGQVVCIKKLYDTTSGGVVYGAYNRRGKLLCSLAYGNNNKNSIATDFRLADTKEHIDKEDVVLIRKGACCALSLISLLANTVFRHKVSKKTRAMLTGFSLGWTFGELAGDMIFKTDYIDASQCLRDRDPFEDKKITAALS